MSWSYIEKSADGTMEFDTGTFLGQLKFMSLYPTEYDNVFPNKNWKLKDFQFMTKLISNGVLVQSDETVGFIWNIENKQKCWTCDDAIATHSVYRDALGEYEKTCDKCFANEYPEEVNYL